MQSIVSAAQMIQTRRSQRWCWPAGWKPCRRRRSSFAGATASPWRPEASWKTRSWSHCSIPICGLYMANTAELYGEQQGITREMQDEFALRSQKRPTTLTKPDASAGRAGAGAAEESQRRADGEMLTEDDHRRPQTTMEGLAKLKPAFGKNGTVTAGNASGIVDGGAAVVVMSLEEAGKRD